MLILNGNEADAKQCIHAVAKKRYLFFFFELIFSMSIVCIMNFLITYIIFFLLFSLDRISITFKKMVEKKLPYKYKADPKLFASQTHKQKLLTR